MKFVLILVSLTILYFFYNEYQDAREEIKEELKSSAVATGDSFDKLNSRISKKANGEKTLRIQTQGKPETENKVILGLESSLSPSVGSDENLLEILEEDPEATLKEIGHLLARDPHSVVWNNSLNLIRNAKINPDQKIDFLKAQLKSSDSLTDDENQNIRVINKYRRITGALKDIYLAESRDLTELAEEMGSTTPPGELQREVKSVLYDGNNN